MATGSCSRLHRRGSALILFTLALPTLILPLAGLAIDLTMLYIVQAKLSAAVDGAALGAGRLLGTGANTETVAKQFVDANFPDKYWGSSNLVKTVQYTQSFTTHKITVSAKVDVPLLFLRVFSQTK
jgi:Flp pilus assembly protein TadG